MKKKVTRSKTKHSPVKKHTKKIVRKHERRHVKKTSTKHLPAKKETSEDSIRTKEIEPETNVRDASTLQLRTEQEIAMDFAIKVYEKFDKMIKSVILFGSAIKQTATATSDIDIILILDDVTIQWDQELIAWYRTELSKLLKQSPYRRELHINTVKLSTWWEDLMKGDATIINVLRHGEAIIDLAGFFEPLKALLLKGKIKATPEAIYSCLQRAPAHLARSKNAELGAIEGLYWSMVDSAHAALIAAKIPPASPEHIALDLKETFVAKKKINKKYVVWYEDLFALHKKIVHGEIKDLRGVEIDDWQDKAEEFLETMAKLVKEIIDKEE